MHFDTGTFLLLALLLQHVLTLKVKSIMMRRLRIQITQIENLVGAIVVQTAILLSSHQ